MALKALYLWQSRWNSSRAMLSFATAADGASVYVHMCAIPYVPGICEWSVCCKKISTTYRAAAKQQQQQNNGNRVSSSCLCASRHGVCVCGLSTAGDRTATATVSRPMQQSNTHLPTSYHAYKAHSSSKRSSSYISLERLCSFFST